MRTTAGRLSLALACAFLSLGTAQPADAHVPDLPEYIQKALTPFRSPPSPLEVAELLDRWQADGGLRDAHDRIIGARLWRLAGESGRALALLDPFPEDGPLQALARYERARILFELGDDNDALRRAPFDWHAACRSLADLPFTEAEGLRQEFWWDLGVLATPDERDEWLEVSSEEA